jgi:hypothetical protein
MIAKAKPIPAYRYALVFIFKIGNSHNENICRQFQLMNIVGF